MLVIFPQLSKLNAPFLGTQAEINPRMQLSTAPQKKTVKFNCIRLIRQLQHNSLSCLQMHTLFMLYMLLNDPQRIRMSNITYSYPLITVTPANSICDLQWKLCPGLQRVIPAENLFSSPRTLPVHRSDATLSAYQYTKLSTLWLLHPGLPVTPLFSAYTALEFAY